MKRRNELYLCAVSRVMSFFIFFSLIYKNAEYADWLGEANMEVGCLIKRCRDLHNGPK